MGRLELGRRASRGPRGTPVLLAAAAGLALAAPALAAPTPKLEGMRCLERCAGIRQVAHGGAILLNGRHLARVDEVRFHGSGGPVVVAPARSGRHAVRASVPGGARSGRVAAIAGSRVARSPTRLRIVGDGALPRAGSFDLIGARARPGRAFFDARGGVRLRFRFRSDRALRIRVRLIRAGGGRVVRSWNMRGALPYSRHRLRWNGLERDGDAADDGGYRFEVGKPAGDSDRAGRFSFRGHRFPIRGPHHYGGSLQRFGAPRSGGRTHEGQDVFAACGTPLQAARGGRVQARGHDPQLYGHYLVVDGRATQADLFYVHLARPAQVGEGQRVRTGERIGAVGKTGNARSVGCHLHFELWPRGFRRGRPADPLGELRRWDRWS